MTNHPSECVAIILLAAGSSSRMGQPKQLLEIEGEPLLLKSTKLAIASIADKVIVVLGANEQTHRKTIEPLPVEIINNTAWQSGMGSSLKEGLQKLLHTTPQLNAVLVMVCDQPLLTAEHLNKLIQTFKTSKCQIVASHYSGDRGVPALFEKSLFEELLNLEDNSGAKKIIQQHKEVVHTIAFPEGIIDLDTPDDYQNFITRKN